jgi:rhodanese-related sulfurtransferase
MNRQYSSINSDQLRAYMAEHGEETYEIIDVRQPVEYHKEHIPGARLLPLGELSCRLTELPEELDIIFY